MLDTPARLAPASLLPALCAALAVQLGAGDAVLAQGASDDVDGPAADKARPRLIAETASIAPGETILIGITFDIEPEWHTYWHGRNDTVPGPWFEFSAPEGFEVGPLRWPAPRRYESAGGLLDHIYEHQVTLVAPLTAPEEIENETVEISAKANWTVCADMCIMGSGTVHLSLPVSDSLSPGPNVGRFADARRRIPRPLNPADEISAERTPERIDIRAAGASRLAFYPHEKGPALSSILRDGESRSGSLTLRLGQGREEAAAPLSGVLEVWREGRRESELIELSIMPGGEVEAVEGQPLPPAPQQPGDGA